MTTPETPKKKIRQRSKTDEAYLKKLGRKVMTARIESRIATDNVATLAGLDRSYYRKIESGTVNPSTLALLAIANVLGVEVTDLLPSK